MRRGSSGRPSWDGKKGRKDGHRSLGHGSRPARVGKAGGSHHGGARHLRLPNTAIEPVLLLHTCVRPISPYILRLPSKFPSPAITAAATAASSITPRSRVSVGSHQSDGAWSQILWCSSILQFSHSILGCIAGNPHSSPGGWPAQRIPRGSPICQ